MEETWVGTLGGFYEERTDVTVTDTFRPGDLLLFEAQSSYAQWPNYESLFHEYADFGPDELFGLTTIWQRITEPTTGIYLGTISHPKGTHIHIIYVDGEPRLVHFLDHISRLGRADDNFSTQG